MFGRMLVIAIMGIAPSFATASMNSGSSCRLLFSPSSERIDADMTDIDLGQLASYLIVGDRLPKVLNHLWLKVIASRVIEERNHGRLKLNDERIVSQKDLSVALTLSQSTVARWELGSFRPTLEWGIQLSKLSDRTPKYFFAIDFLRLLPEVELLFSELPSERRQQFPMAESASENGVWAVAQVVDSKDLGYLSIDALVEEINRRGWAIDLRQK